MSSNQERFQTSDDESLAQSSSIISYDDSSIVDTSIINNNEQNAFEPPKQDNILPFYRRRRFWAICLAVTVVLSAIFIPILFFVILPVVAQRAINHSNLDLQSIIITNATNDDCIVSMSGSSTGAGSFNAKIEFVGPATTYFDGQKFGNVELENFSISGGKGAIESKGKKLIIEDKQQFIQFVSTTLTKESFTWNIRGNVNIRTLGIIKINNLKLNKDITILGSNNFSNSSLLSLKVNPSPDKSLRLNILASLYNPSPIGIELGDMYLQLMYNGTTVANATSKGVTIKSKENILAMDAATALPTNNVDIYNYLKVMEAYVKKDPITTNVKILSIVSPNGEKVDWINSAVQNLNLTSTVGQTKAPQIRR